jgi:hypothetical protein
MDCHWICRNRGAKAHPEAGGVAMHYWGFKMCMGFRQTGIPVSALEQDQLASRPIHPARVLEIQIDSAAGKWQFSS